jgi:hypothetical protein
MTATRQRITEILLRIQDAFLDTPGLMLTLQEAKLLFGVDEATCAAILETLTDSRVLGLTRNGAYVRQFPMTNAA